ncbi:MAG TPA: CAP domain-containing protein [Candidatus Dormibacteraeota bacterium]|nr:CAP domain-containing protein [Candidatus Dormibacteraeota bacterium]
MWGLRWFGGGSTVLAVGALAIVALQSPQSWAPHAAVPATAASFDPGRLVAEPGSLIGPARLPATAITGQNGRRIPAAVTLAVGSYEQVLINRDRAAAGLHPLGWNGCLARIAGANARRMAVQGYISHTNGASLDLGCGLGVQGGENVGWWSGGVNDAQLNAMFMASPDHRANIMGPYHYVATAWAVGANGYAYIAVEFT